MQKVKLSLKDKWILFLNILFDPWVITLLVIISFTIYSYSMVQENNLKTFLTIIISILSSLIGAIITKKWSDINDEKIIVARGIGAIRNLKLLLLNIYVIEKRVRIYLQRIKKNEPENQLIINCYEEIIERFNILEEEGLSSIESWTDIIPEANVKTQIGLISDLKEKENELTIQFDRQKSELENDKKDNLKENEKLQTKLNETEKELKIIKKELKEKEVQLNSSVLSGLSTPSGSINLSGLTSEANKNYLNKIYIDPRSLTSWKVCEKCGSLFAEKPGIISLNKLCDNCLNIGNSSNGNK